MLETRGREFFLDGKKINIYSGTMHYFRVVPGYWEDRMRKMKACGLNTVETYVAWNIHEPREGQFVFDGNADIVKFIETAKKVGLYVIVRPGPYICAEWDFGGFPAWLLRDDDILLRCYNEKYIGYVTKYFKELLPRLVPHQLSKGGNIIAVQIENEYGSYADDKKYLRYMRDLIREQKIDGMLFTSDGESRYHFSGGSLPDEFKVANFGCTPADGFRDLKEFQPDKPLMCGEYWYGWYTQWSRRYSPIITAGNINKAMNEYFAEDANFNIYMFHGGTNFGFMAGANYYDGKYFATTTTYDYKAPISEFGGYNAKYHALRKIFLEKQNLPISAPLPAEPKFQNIGKVELTEYADLLENLTALGEKHEDHMPHYMEHYGQNSGYILYHTEIEGDYPDTSIGGVDVHDIAYVYVDGKFIGRYNRSDADKKGQCPEYFNFPIPAFKGKISVDILVEGMGRINFGRKIYDRKGLKNICIGEQYHFGDYTIYTLPMDNLEKLKFKKVTANMKMDKPVMRVLKGSFNAKTDEDCFVDMLGFSKGVVYINGFNLGRYWNIGPQRTLYIPAPLLKAKNEIMIFEQESYKAPSISITDKCVYGKYEDKVSFAGKLKKIFKKVK